VPIVDWILAISAPGRPSTSSGSRASSPPLRGRDGWPNGETADTLILNNFEGLIGPVIYPQVIVGAIGIVLLLEASRRALGPALTDRGGRLPRLPISGPAG
jgi:TRAP-type uncharacterized transport system fused permease subunit